MKTMKKLLTLTLVLAMVLSLAISASAITITVDNGVSGAKYDAYRILNAEDLGNSKFAYTLNSKYEEILKTATGKTTEAEILQYIDDLDSVESIEANPNAVQDFANTVYKAILAAKLDSDGASTGNTIDVTEQGYYLVAETTTANGQDVHSLVMLDTAGKDNITVKTKEDQPSLTKQVKHDETGTWGNVGDNQIGETVEFRTESDVPNHTQNYESYSYVIHDTMGTGLTSNVQNGNANGDVKIKVNDAGDPIDAKYVTVTATDNSFTIAIDIKQAIEDGVMAAGDKLYTYYTGVLNGEAPVANSYLENTAYLKYSNDPYDANSTADSAYSKAYEYTFHMQIDKVDGDTQEKLEGAKFVLSTSDDLDVTFDDETGLSAIDGLIALVDEGNDVYHIATPAEIADDTVTKVYDIEAGNPTIEGLDDATLYYLYEVKAPVGYNLVEEPTKVEITATYSGEAMPVPSATMKVNDVEQEGMVVSVNNNSGIELPSTGGIGTTIFYVVGGLLAVGAVILLVTKKKMTNEG